MTGNSDVAGRHRRVQKEIAATWDRVVSDINRRVDESGYT
jgi:hypothetical protein